MGGVVPLGYSLEGRRLVVQPGEAESVKRIFNRYLELGSVSNCKEAWREPEPGAKNGPANPARLEAAPRSTHYG
jgi:hypothetical protein